METAAERGFACMNDCVGYCSCSLCIGCGEQGQWTIYCEGIGFVCDACDRRDHPERYESDDEAEDDLWIASPD